MRKGFSILLPFLSAVLMLISAYAFAKVPSAAQPDAAPVQQSVMQIAASRGREGLGQGEFWWSNMPAAELCANRSYAAYDPAARQLLLRSGNRYVRVLETDVELTRGLSVSPHCRYIAAEVANGADAALVIWDAAAGTRAAELPAEAGNVPLVIWSPNGDRALIRAADDYLLWDSCTESALVLHPADEINAYPSVYWDERRDQVLIDGAAGALTFDLKTGSPLF